MGGHYVPDQELTDPMPRSNSTEAITTGQGGLLPPPAPVAFGYNPKLEFDEDDDDFADMDVISPNGRGKGLSKASQNPEPESGPISGTSTKRKRPLKLTPSQRERKRAIDREAQRSIRIKTKNYIAHLENLVKVMEQSDTAGPDGDNHRTRELMNQLKQSQDEVRSLREAMLSVQRTLGAVLGDSSNLNPDHFLQRQSSHSASPPSVTEAQSTMSFVGPAQFPPQSQPSHVPPPPQPQTNASTVPLAPFPSQAEPPIPTPRDMPERPNSGPRCTRADGELFLYAEYHLNRVYAAGHAAFGDTTFDEDIPVRAVIEGWAEVEERHSLDLCWQVIREVDQVVWANSGVVERMAIIRFMRAKLRHQVNSRAAAPFPPLPAFMTQEVAKHAPHADIIDHFIWPGFRHCLVEQPQKYSSSHFSDKFRFNLKFLWPFDISSAYTKDPVTLMYTSTHEFVHRQWDIRCWTMKTKFFHDNHELTACIPRFDVQIQKPLTLPGQDGMEMSDMAHQGNAGMVEDQEVDEEALDGSSGIVNDASISAAVGGGWHSISPSHSMPQYWTMTAMNATGMDQSYNGLVSHVGTGYSM